MINGNILIVSDQKMYKIYDDHASNKIDPSIQAFKKFLPEPENDKKDRCMTASLARNCPRHNRLLLQFHYPESWEPKEVIVIPYIGANSLSMNGLENLDHISWLSKPSRDTPTRLFQFSWERKKVLNEFNLNGALRKSTSFENEFEDYTELARDHQYLRFLISPEADDYFKRMVLVEITEEHQYVQKREINTEELKLQIGHIEVNLFEVFYQVKNKLKGFFTLELNSNKMEIAISCFLPSNRLLALFLITQRPG